MELDDKLKDIKPHGMSSEKASRVKKRGQNKEYIYAKLIGGEVVNRFASLSYLNFLHLLVLLIYSIGKLELLEYLSELRINHLLFFE